MIRLTILTLIGLFAVLSMYGGQQGGSPAPAASVVPTTAAPAPAATDAPAETAPLQPAPQPEPTIVTEAAAIQPAEVMQTPVKVQDFPGLPLRPSPEHAGSTEQVGADLAAPEGATVLYVTGDRVNFRAGPLISDRVVGALLRGSPTEAISRTDDGWVQLRDAQGREGYMSAQFLSPEHPR